MQVVAGGSLQQGDAGRERDPPVIPNAFLLVRFPLFVLHVLLVLSPFLQLLRPPPLGGPQAVRSRQPLRERQVRKEVRVA